jgi:hypothetical protein
MSINDIGDPSQPMSFNPLTKWQAEVRTKLLALEAAAATKEYVDEAIADVMERLAAKTSPPEPED